MLNAYKYAVKNCPFIQITTQRQYKSCTYARWCATSSVRPLNFFFFFSLSPFCIWGRLDTSPPSIPCFREITFWSRRGSAKQFDKRRVNISFFFWRAVHLAFIETKVSPKLSRYSVRRPRVVSRFHWSTSKWQNLRGNKKRLKKKKNRPPPISFRLGGRFMNLVYFELL